MGPRERIVVTGGARLVGSVRVTGAKNSVLKTMAASLLAPGTTTLLDVPQILDVDVMGRLLATMGCEVVHDGGAVRITVPAEPAHEADYDLVRRIRGSICVLGPLVGRVGRAQVALPGGDSIGSRGLDLHVAGLRALGADVEVEHGYVVARAGRLVGTRIDLDFPSVGATENVVMAAVLAKGGSLVDNVAREPEIVDLLTMLVQMGAKIDGIGTSTLEIEGVDELRPTVHTTVPDRIVAGTFAVAAVMTGGDVTVLNGRADHLAIPLGKLRAAGAVVTEVTDGFRVQMTGTPRAVDVATLPYPGFPTDLQPAFVALASVSEGTAMVTENIFDGRFVFLDELARLGADVRTDGHHAVIRGRTGSGSASGLPLSGAPVRASDIRAGVGLVLGGLVADGRTDVYDAFHVDRGYAGLCEQLTALGAQVRREPQPDDAY